MPKTAIRTECKRCPRRDRQALVLRDLPFGPKPDRPANGSGM
jgi:hypothetical protein